MDLKRFFDEIPHDLILKLIRKKTSDEQFVPLIAKALKVGLLVEGKYEKTTKKCSRGCLLSPIVSTLVLNKQDQELEKRGHPFC
ncbi:MAG: hypothetical protein JW932_16290 [Deltaproteobacteria bacterium]|nr:hypothetical protein [Deltaproteobacteria bacterium]